MNLKYLINRYSPAILWDLYRRYKYQKGVKKKVDDSKNGITDKFKSIYEENFWNSSESYSGTGSVIDQTKVIVSALPELFKKYKINTMLDAPCGDFNWMRHVDISNIKYTGGDIVDSLIQKNKENYSHSNIDFLNVNLLSDELDQYDLVFCRDCLVHFSYKDISKAIINIINSGSRYLLTTSFIDRRINFDIETGDWRPINLQKSPFNFPKPIEIIIEKCTEGNGKSYDKALLLYLIEDIPIPNESN